MGAEHEAVSRRMTDLAGMLAKQVRVDVGGGYGTGCVKGKSTSESNEVDDPATHILREQTGPI